jgi:PAS domain S-box-containing protein
MPQRAIAIINGEQKTLPDLVAEARAKHARKISKYFAFALSAQSILLALFLVVQYHGQEIVIGLCALMCVLSFSFTKPYSNQTGATYLNPLMQMVLSSLIAMAFYSQTSLIILFAISIVFTGFYRNVRALLLTVFIASASLALFESVAFVPSLTFWQAAALWCAEGFLLAVYCIESNQRLWAKQCEIFETARTAGIGGAAIPNEIKEKLGETTDLERYDRYASLIKNSSDAIIFHDLEGTIKSWNMGAELLLGLREGEMKGKHLNTILPEDYRKTYWGNVSELRNFAHLPSFEIQLQSNGSEPIYVSATITEIDSTRGDTVNVSLTARDITRQREAEAHVSELYGMVSHELRTPLTSLRGSLTLLDEKMVEVDSEDGRSMLKIARQGTEKLLKIVNDILDIRKLEAGRMQFHREVVRVDELINQSVLAMQKIAASRNVKLTIAVSEEAHVSADRERIIQVLANFLSNAVKYSDEGGEVQIQAVLRQSGNVRFSVVDSGKGIPADKQGTLFQKFHSVGHSTSPSSLTGAGLGLAICKSVVQQHEGTIGLISEEGKGSTFWFELKALGRSTRASGTVVVAAVKHTLLVSDNEAVVEAMHKTLTKNGIGCRLIARAEDALPVAESVQPAAVFIDANFVGSNLLELVQSINRSAPSVRTVIYRSVPDAEPAFSHAVAIRVVSEYSQLAPIFTGRTKPDKNVAGFLTAGDLPDHLTCGELACVDWIAASTANGLVQKADGKPLLTVVADLDFLVHEKFEPLTGCPIAFGCLIALIHKEMSPEDESFAILSLQSDVLVPSLSESEFLGELNARA